MKLGAFVTTFDRPAILRATLTQLLGQTRPPDYILVIDNGTNPETQEVPRAFDPSRVGYHRMGYNSGPAGAGAYGVGSLADRGFDWILCGDDDDPPLTRDAIERLMRAAAAPGGRIGAVGATGTPWDWKRGVRTLLAELPRNAILDVDVVGGSKQLIVSRLAVHEAGTPNSDLFFGLDDIDYCLRIRRAGFRITVDSDLFRDYLLVMMYRKSKTLPQGSMRPRDEIWRQYYSTRNYIYLMREEFERHGLARREVAKAMLRIGNSWRGGWEYGLSFTKLQLIAIVDGYSGKLGLVVPPRTKRYIAGGEQFSAPPE